MDLIEDLDWRWSPVVSFGCSLRQSTSNSRLSSWPRTCLECSFMVWESPSLVVNLTGIYVGENSMIPKGQRFCILSIPWYPFWITKCHTLSYFDWIILRWEHFFTCKLKRQLSDNRCLSWQFFIITWVSRYNFLFHTVWSLHTYDILPRIQKSHDRASECSRIYQRFTWFKL